MPGLLFWPPEHQLDSDGPKRNWLGHRQAEVEGVLEKQMIADAAQGFHYIGYHGYAKRLVLYCVILCVNDILY